MRRGTPIFQSETAAGTKSGPLPTKKPTCLVVRERGATENSDGCKDHKNPNQRNLKSSATTTIPNDSYLSLNMRSSVFPRRSSGRGETSRDCRVRPTLREYGLFWLRTEHGVHLQHRSPWYRLAYQVVAARTHPTLQHRRHQSPVYQ